MSGGAAPRPLADAARRRGASAWSRVRAEAGLAGIFAATLLFFSLVSPFFLRIDNLVNILSSAAIVGLLAVPTTLVIIAGGIDLSIGAVVALSSVLVAQLSPVAPLSVAVIAGALTGAAVGAINGLAITRFGINAFIATLGMLSIARGLAFVASGGLTQPVLHRSLGALARDPLILTDVGGRRLALTPHVMVMLAAFALGAWVLRETTFGRAIYAVGGNAQAARLAGIAVPRVQLAAYVLSGLSAAFGGICFASQFGAGAPAAAAGIELQVIAAVILGGASLSGGKGTMSGTLLGVLLLGTLNNGLTLLNVSSYYQEVARGAALLAAVGLDRLRRRLLQTD